jgi:hypothetical protein
LHIEETGANKVLVLGAILGMFAISALMLYHTSQKDIPLIGLYILGTFALSFAVEFLLRTVKTRVIKKQIHESMIVKIEKKLKKIIEKE